MQDRRKFLKKALLFSSASLFPAVPEKLYSNFVSTCSLAKKTGPENFNDEEFWSIISKEFNQNPSIINFNNGGVSPQPQIVKDALVRLTKLFSEAPSYYMWRVYVKNLETVREKLAAFSGASTDEIAITRNATESLTNVIFGLNLNKGDEVVMSNWDYPNMIHSWKQRELRDGIIVKEAQLDTISENEDEIIKKFEEVITPNTKALHITHIINWTGQILPVKKLCDLARKKGIISIVDGAHSFNHLNFKISDLGCDYFGASLHKWLGAPVGTGLLYIQKDRIKSTWPLSSSDAPNSDDIKKFENYGTYPMANKLGIAHAIDFMDTIGIQQKEDRLRYLKNYWANSIKGMDRIQLDTSLLDDFSCGIASFHIDGMDSIDVSNYLFHKSAIHSTVFKKNGKEGIRISPNIYTSLKDLDLLTETVKGLLS